MFRLDLGCWNNCDQQLGPFPLNINSALRQGSLVITDIAWDQAITNASKQCLVTWEVSGGGLMGNLLTDSSTVELSLWSDTIYHVQVTCKHKVTIFVMIYIYNDNDDDGDDGDDDDDNEVKDEDEDNEEENDDDVGVRDTGGMRRSYKLIVDTHKLGDSTATGMQAIALETPFSKSLPHIYGNDALPASMGENDSRMRILKDSSKDFLTPYNPNAIIDTKPSLATPTTSATRATATTTTTTTTTIAGATTSTTSSIITISTKDELKNSYSAEYEVESGDTVISTKLIGVSNLVQTSSDFLSQSIVLAVVGSIVLFCGIIALYLLMPPIHKQVPVTICSIDHEVLIHNEIMPSQSPLNPTVSLCEQEGSLQTPKTTEHKNRSTLHV
uniref:Uncharacterized protein n=1 Tax=Glossina palpalis gambiensis TaxID=67801 RepID=A0A1B0ASI6_9MUSC